MSNYSLVIENIDQPISDYFDLKIHHFELNVGEVHMLIGRNASGKSSLANLLAGNTPIMNGQIRINDERILINSPSDALRNGIFLINHESSLLNQFSIAENIFMGIMPLTIRALKLINWPKLYKECQNLFDTFHIKLNPRTPVGHLDNSQKQIIELLKAYISKARFILIDEPVSSLSQVEHASFFDVIQNMKREDFSFLIISHQLESIGFIGDKISIIRDGELILTDNVKNLELDKMIHIIAGSDWRKRYPKLPIKFGKEIFRVENLRFCDILNGISFTLKEREIIGITGLIGSGRTLIARSLVGLNKRDSGTIFVRGIEQTISSPIEAIRLGISYITENRHDEGLFSEKSIQANIIVTSSKESWSNFLVQDKQNRRTVRRYIERLQIKPNGENRIVSALSGGNQQKVLLARSLASRSSILIMDEPTRGIDVAAKIDVYNLMTEWVDRGAEIILLSSDINELIGMCDKVLVLFEGKIAKVLNHSEATGEKIVAYATGCLR